MMKPLLDVIIISFNTRDLTLRCIQSVKETCALPHSITVVDNNSTDDTASIVQKTYPDTQLIKCASNMGYAAAVNAGMAKTDADICLITNADVLFFPNAIAQLHQYITAHSDVGVTGLQQVYPDGSWQRSYGWYPGIKSGLYDLFGINKFANFLHRRRFVKPNKPQIPLKVEYLDGAILMTRRKAFDEVGGFDESFFFYAEETDYCFRLQKNGWKNIFCSWIYSEHIRGASSTALPRIESVQLLVNGKIQFIKKHAGQNFLILYTLLELLYFYNAETTAKILTLFSKNSPFWQRKCEHYAIFTGVWQDVLLQLRSSTISHSSTEKQRISQ